MASDRRSYREKLLDPRWQRKRLEVLNRDGFTCRFCGDKTTTLHVHHKFYRRGCDPWDYEADALLTLCAPCHESETKERADVVAAIGESLAQLNWSTDDLRVLGSSLHDAERSGIPAFVFAEVISAVADDAGLAICNLWFNVVKERLTSHAFEDRTQRLKHYLNILDRQLSNDLAKGEA